MPQVKDDKCDVCGHGSAYHLSGTEKMKQSTVVPIHRQTPEERREESFRDKFKSMLTMSTTGSTRSSITDSRSVVDDVEGTMSGELK